MILINNLSVSYNKRKVINSLNLSLKEHAIHGIVGLNGSGKTTLLNTIFGIKKQESGEILFNGKNINKKQIAYLPTENFFYSYITGYEYLALIKNNNFNIEEWNNLFQIPLNENIDIYSTGMKKRLALLAILKQQKDIIILDEPFNGLDIEMSKVILLILKKLKESGSTIIVSSHIIETLLNLCDYIHHLNNGKIMQTTDKYGFNKLEDNIFTNLQNKSASIINKLI